MGFNYLLEIAGFIGVSLAVFNLLPVPALDGARAVFVIIEWIRKKPINRNIEGTIHAIGLILLLIFAIGIDLIKCV
jgi:regulator of sigma E protease